MANGDDHVSAAADRWVRTVVGEINRFRSLRPRRPGKRRALRHTPMPPEVKAAVDKSMAVEWPLTQSTRDGMVAQTAQRMAGLRGSFALLHGAVPEPEARRAAAAAEAEGFAAACAFAAGKASLATDEERADVVRRYVQEVWRSACRSRRQALAAAGTSTAGAGPAAALPPPPGAAASAAVAVVVSGAVQQPSSSAPR